MTKKRQPPKTGERVRIPVSSMEFSVDGTTIWIQDRRGGTAFRIRTNGMVKIEVCQNSPLSHGDLIVNQDIDICLSKNAQY